MAKKLDELPIATTVCAPRSKGTCDINVDRCLFCQQSDSSKISVVSESKERIKHSLGPDEGEEGDVYELECDVCHARYRLGVVTRERHGPKGDYNFNSLFGSDERTKNRWLWIGYF